MLTVEVDDLKGLLQPMIALKKAAMIILGLWKYLLSVQLSGYHKWSTADPKSAICSYAETSFAPLQPNCIIAVLYKDVLHRGASRHTQ